MDAFPNSTKLHATLTIRLMMFLGDAQNIQEADEEVVDETEEGDEK